jgi:hypothetical protein
MADGRENLIRKAIRDTKELSVASTTLLSLALPLRLMILQAELLLPDSDEAMNPSYPPRNQNNNHLDEGNWLDDYVYGIDHRTSSLGLTQKRFPQRLNVTFDSLVLTIVGDCGMIHVHYIFT